MLPIAHPRVKICCIASGEEAALAVRYGASALGLVSAMPSGPGPISEDKIAAIARTIPPGVTSILLTSRQDAESIIIQQKRCRVNALQMVDRVQPGTYRALRDLLPGVTLIQVIHVNGRGSVDEALSLDREVDALVLDSGNPFLPVKELGGTGRIHDWTISRTIREAVNIPVYLAGGLRPENVRLALDEVGPFAVDVCSGVRTAGKLDEEKLTRFMQEVHND
jgi:phosphoribosylanthranilate isomerase